MAYLRTVKASFFTSEDVVSLSPLARLLYIGLWCEADREGRLKWAPLTFRLRYLPTDACDIEAVCRELTDRQMVVLYGHGLAYIPTFLTHQRPNNREAVSLLPDPRDACSEPRDATFTRESRVREVKEREGKEREVCDARDTPPVVVSLTADYGALPTRRRKAHCAWESAIGLDVPQFLHDEFAAKLAVAGTAPAALVAWYGTVEAQVKAAGTVVGEDAIKFWRAKFAEQYGTPGPVRVPALTGGGRVAPTRPASVPVTDPDYRGAEYRFHCSHSPTCTTWPQCRDHETAVAS